MNAIIAILCSVAVSFFTAAAIGYLGMHKGVPNLFLLVFGWTLNASVAIMIYNILQ